MNHNNLWYFRRGQTVKGPFPAGLISRYILLGRIRLSDELSQDRDEWRRVEDVPAMIPDVMRADPDDEQAQRRLQAARRWADERDAYERAAAAAGQWDGPERREGEGEESGRVPHREDEAVRSRPSEHYLLQLFAILLALGGVVALAIFYTPDRDAAAANCRALPAPGVNWSNCRLQGVQVLRQDMREARLHSADLSGANFFASDLSATVLAYSDLSLADLRFVELAGARLTGANLRGADLSNANLTHADLSYANLSGARLAGARLEGAKLDNAIWVNEQTCLPGSLGACLTVE